MRILLQDNHTKLYLGRGGVWTSHPGAALAFLDEVRAKDYGVYHRLREVQVVQAGVDDAESARAPEIPPSEPPRSFVSESCAAPKEATNHLVMEMKTKRTEPAPGLPPIQPTSKEKTRRKPKAAKPPLSQPAPPVEQPTQVEARIDVGLGNALFIRGQGDGLNWDKGAPLQCVDGKTWSWVAPHAKDKVVFKLLLNDQAWSKGADLVVEAGRKIEVTPEF